MPATLLKSRVTIHIRSGDEQYRQDNTLLKSLPAAEACVMLVQTSLTASSGLNASTTRVVCWTNSLEGARSRAYGLLCPVLFKMSASIGSTNARVLPLPVGEIASTSLPSRSIGSTWLCTAVGRSSPIAGRAKRSALGSRCLARSFLKACSEG